MANLPGFTYLCTLGRGSTATVSLVSDPISGRLLAVKSADISLSSPLQQEHQILSTLSSPHVVSCYGSYTSPSQLHILLEFASGGSLFNRIQQGQLDEHTIRSYARDILLGLSYLHLNNISHGDIKSSNVLISSDGHAKLADFGAAVQNSGPHNGKSSPLSGTPAFMSPEVARGEERGPAADIWALGCTIIEMATGKAPWDGIIKESDVIAAIYHIGFCPDSMPDIPNWLSKDARDFLTNCLTRDRKERWSAEQLLCHPFLCSAEVGLKRDGNLDFVISPQSALDFPGAFCESETEEEEVELVLDPFLRIRELAGSVLGWDHLISNPDGEDCWIEVRSGSGENSQATSERLDFCEEDCDVMLFNLGHIFERINDNIKVRCENIATKCNVCKVDLANKAVNSGFDQNLNCLPLCFRAFAFLSCLFCLKFSNLLYFGEKFPD